jgi:hypothetical protein
MEMIFDFLDGGTAVEFVRWRAGGLLGFASNTLIGAGVGVFFTTAHSE